jgi:acyl-CoA reductase-like NAD-dependent aldehyde dehydrogenase
VTLFEPNLRAATFLAKPGRLFIDGRWQEAVSGKTFEVIDPATARVIATVAEGDAADIDLAVQAAHRSFADRRWRGLTADDRARVLWRYADLIEQHSDELVQLEVQDNGMVLAFAHWMVRSAASWLRYHAGLGLNIAGRNTSPAVSGNGRQIHAYTTKEPIGVAGLILPWNGPIGTFALKVATALSAGCSVVVKPAENTPLTALRLTELAQAAGVPDGVLNVVTGFGGVAGQALVDHDLVRKISFTGSTQVGKHIVRAATGNMKRVTLELGGKSPCIIFDDADLDAAIAGAASGIFSNTGQMCMAGSRLFVHRKVFDKVVAGIGDIARSLKVGSGFDAATAIGPLISLKQQERVAEFIDIGKAEGAELVTGGRAIPRAGYFIEPTVFANVQADMRIMREEIFGPVLVATPFDDIEPMIHAANDTRYGLASGIFTRDINKAHLVASRLEAGTVWINGYGEFQQTMPFGGYKESGWGRELGSDSLDAFLETKSVIVTLAS